MSVTKAIREEIDEIDARVAQYKARRDRLVEALRMLAPEEHEPNGSSVTRRTPRTREDWYADIRRAAVVLEEFTVPELADEIHSPAESVYKYVKDLLAEGLLVESNRTGPRNAKMFKVVG